MELGRLSTDALAVVNGCVKPSPGLVAREIIDLPAVPYHTLHLPSRADDPLVTDLLSAVRTALRRP